MAYVTYETGIKCKRCGNLSLSINRFQTRVLCQNCGEHIMDFDPITKEGTVQENADIVTVKVTHKLFSNIYEEV